MTQRVHNEAQFSRFQALEIARGWVHALVAPLL